MTATATQRKDSDEFARALGYAILTWHSGSGYGSHTQVMDTLTANCTDEEWALVEETFDRLNRDVRCERRAWGWPVRSILGDYDWPEENYGKPPKKDGE